MAIEIFNRYENKYLVDRSQYTSLIGVDTPENTSKTQCYGKNATNFAMGLLGQTVYLESDSVSGDVDTYGRYLRYIYLADGTNFNMQLIEDGYGMLYVFNNQSFKYRPAFSAAEQDSRSNNKGLWGSCSTRLNKYGNYEVVN